MTSWILGILGFHTFTSMKNLLPEETLVHKCQETKLFTGATVAQIRIRADSADTMAESVADSFDRKYQQMKPTTVGLYLTNKLLPTFTDESLVYLKKFKIHLNKGIFTLKKAGIGSKVNLKEQRN